MLVQTFHNTELITLCFEFWHVSTYTVSRDWNTQLDYNQLNSLPLVSGSTIVWGCLLLFRQHTISHSEKNSQRISLINVELTQAHSTNNRKRKTERMTYSQLTAGDVSQVWTLLLVLHHLSWEQQSTALIVFMTEWCTDKQTNRQTDKQTDKGTMRDYFHSVSSITRLIWIPKGYSHP